MLKVLVTLSFMTMIMYKNNKRQLLLSAIVLVAMVWPAFGAFRTVLAAAPHIGVLYPDVRSPYQDVFMDIIKGVEDVTKDSIKLYDIKKDYDERALRQTLEKTHIDVVIALGRRGIKAAGKLSDMFEVVAGAAFLSPNGKSNVTAGISLNPDPEILFSRLKELVPRVTRVSVVYNLQRNNWLIERAKRTAKRHDLSLNAVPANNLKEAAALYREIVRDADASQAVWLLQDHSTLDKRVILAMILKRAWEKQFVVFSGNPGHVRQGALFSLYPDNIGMGRSIGGIVMRRSKSNTTNDHIIPVRDLLIAVNIRTAKRLELKFTSAQEREFDLVFPSK
jgi:putative ABC transport system substrate-binding protein